MMKNIEFRKAKIEEAPEIWKILEAAILRRKVDGSLQWQNGYPNLATVQEDIINKKGYILHLNNEIIAYSAISKNDEPAYEKIDGKWLSNGEYFVIHRIAVAEKFLKQGFAKKIIVETEQFAIQQNIFSVKIDTNFDNFAMLKICEDLAYQYCGIVMMNGSERKAFEKILKI